MTINVDPHCIKHHKRKSETTMAMAKQGMSCGFCGCASREAFSEQQCRSMTKAQLHQQAKFVRISEFQGTVFSNVLAQGKKKFKFQRITQPAVQATLAKDRPVATESGNAGAVLEKFQLPKGQAAASPPSTPVTAKKPPWLRQRAPQGEKYEDLKDSLRSLKLNTVSSKLLRSCKLVQHLMQRFYLRALGRKFVAMFILHAPMKG